MEAELMTQGTQIQELLGLKLPAVAIAFRDTAPAGIPRVSAPTPAGCGYWKLAAEGQVFYTKASDHYTCPVGAHTHGVDLPPQVATELNGLVQTMVGMQYLTMAEIPMIPRRQETFHVAVYAPLTKATFTPDVVLVRGTVKQLMLLAASLIFYAFWDVRFVSLLISSILVNYGIGLAIWACTQQGRHWAASLLLSLGVAANLAAIGVFKYAGFFVRNINLLSGTDIFLGEIILPLGISFFTFEQISFLVDVRHGQSRPSDPLRYALFVSFFPRVVAGPILRFGEIDPQLARSLRKPLVAEDLMVGLTIFFFGLVKKTVLADGVAPYATSVSQSASTGSRVDFFSAWSGVLAYTCQLYFDFSGYSDMAIGVARCFGIRFPMNFFSPYQATNIVEFWRRWHITLSRFLRDYLYIGLGGNRRGTTRRYMNLMITMLLGGLWHGANWTFVIWGGLHGCYLMINQAWLAASRNSAVKSNVWPNCDQSIMMPRTNPASPRRVTRNALRAAAAALGLWNQNPINR